MRMITASVLMGLIALNLSFNAQANTFITENTKTDLWASSCVTSTMYAKRTTEIRREPSLESEVLDVAPFSCSFEVVDTQDGWSMIETCDGYAYIEADALIDRCPRSLGRFKLTYYDPHPCCGTGNGITASGRKAEVGRTIAMSKKWVPLGTHVLIDGHEYVVDDRGVTGRTVDVLVATHKEARNRGVNYAEVYVLE